MSNIIQVDDNYKKWLNELSDRFRNAQIKAAVRVNSEMLQFYWLLGRDISQMELTSKYGSGFYKRLSKDLKELFPDSSSFSETNLKYMKYFYDLYAEIENRPQVVDDSGTSELRPQVVDDLTDFGKIFMIPWRVEL
ncbi:MAG: hypothetical protein IK990_02200 [Ruminiclostridium sp.]|nr:hypothetical protein [Ruminiclostridium sp.]